MAWTISPDIEAALYEAAERRLPDHVTRGKHLTEAVITRSRRYTSERDELAEPGPVRVPGSKLKGSVPAAPQGYEAAADLAARALFFTVADAAKIMIPLAELDAQALLPEGPLEILDIGAGAGAMTLGVLDYLRRTGAHERPVVVRAVDRDAQALAILSDTVRALARQWGMSVTVHIEAMDVRGGALPRGRAQGADLVLAGTVLNELSVDERHALIQAMLGATRTDGAMILIEPALRETARDLHELRDWLVSERLAYVFAPCTRRQAPCPALADARDWCHEDRTTSLPERTARLAANTGLRQNGLKFAYLTVRKQPDGQCDELDSGLVALRVVSHGQRSKGKIELLGCGERGRVAVRLLRRERALGNRDFERARRGDVLIVPERLADGGDISSDDMVDLEFAPEPEA